MKSCKIEKEDQIDSELQKNNILLVMDHADGILKNKA